MTDSPGAAERRRVVLAALGLAAGQLFWAGNAVLARGVVRDTIPPFSLSFWRWLLAAALLLLIARRHLARDRAVLLAHRWRVLAMALTGVASFNTFLYLAAQWTTAVNITLISQALPVVTLALAWLVLRAAPQRRQLAGIAVATPGLAIVIGRGSLDTLLALDVNRGDLLIVVAVLLWGLYSVLLKRWALPVHPLSLLTAMVLAALPLLTVLYGWELTTRGGFEVTAASLAAIAYVGIFASILAYLAWNHGVHVVGPGTAAVYGYLHPLFTVLLAVPLLGERLAPFHLLGGGLVIAGVALTLGPLRATARR